MGFLLLCVGIQFLINGISDIVVAEDFLKRIADNLGTLESQRHDIGSKCKVSPVVSVYPYLSIVCLMIRKYNVN